MRSGAWGNPSASATSFIAWVRAPISLILLILLRCNAWAALSLARSIRVRFSPRPGTRIVTSDPRSPLSHASRSARLAGSMGMRISRGTGAIGASKSARPVCSNRSWRVLVACALVRLSEAVTLWVAPIASLRSRTLIGWAPSPVRELWTLPRSWSKSAYTWTMRSDISSSSPISSTRSTVQLRSPRIDPSLTKNTWTDASSSSEDRPKTSASTSWSRTTEFCCMTVCSIAISSRSLAARSKSRSSLAVFISRPSWAMYDLPTLPVSTPTSRSHWRRWSASLIRPTQGAEHLPMEASRHGLPVRRALLNTPSEHVRTGKVLSSLSRLCRRSHTFAYGPKYLVSRRFLLRVTHTRGTLSPTETARYG